MHQFTIFFKKISFKATPKQSFHLLFNLLQDNKIIDETLPLELNKGRLSYTLSGLQPLKFVSRPENTRSPVFIQVALESKIKKMVLRRSELLKEFSTNAKASFPITEDLDVCKVEFEVHLEELKRPSQGQLPQTKLNSQFSKPSTVQIDFEGQGESPPNEMNSSRGLKRPSTLQVNNTAARIRKSSGNKQKLEEVIQEFRQSIKIQENTEQNSAHKLMGSSSNPQQSLFSGTFGGIRQVPMGQQVGDPKSQEFLSQVEDMKKTHHPTDDQASHHGHQSHQESRLSVKLKIVILMLIAGFMFLMYDALDDRFSRKVTEFSEAPSKRQNRSQKPAKKRKKSKNIQKGSAKIKADRN